MRKATPSEIDDQGKQFIKTAKELGCDESEANFRTALRKIVRHKPKGGDLVLSDVLKKYGVPEGQWSYTEAVDINSVWHVAIYIKDKPTQHLTVGAAVGIVDDLRRLGKSDLADAVESKLKIVRAR